MEGCIRPVKRDACPAANPHGGKGCCGPDEPDKVIAVGLTRDCAQALAQDLGDLLRTRVASVAREFRA